MNELIRLRGLYFAYFAYVGIASPFLSLYLVEHRFSITQIGVLMSVPQWMRIISPPFWGWLADTGASAYRLLRISTLLTLVMILLLPLAAPAGFAAVLLLLAALYFVNGAQMPIGEARTLAITRGDAGAYGRTRVWGSIGFMLAVALVGLALDAWGMVWLPAWMALAMIGLLFAVWPMTASDPPPASEAVATLVRLRERLRQAHIVAFFLGNALMIFAHAAYYVLFSLFLERHGFSKSEIGLLWTLGVLAEVVLFRWQRRLFERFSTLGLLGFSMVVAAGRFLLIGQSDGLLLPLLLAQLMHAVTFGLHHSAVMKTLHQWFDARQQARAQAMYITLAYGMGGALGGLAMSALWAQVSPPAAFVGAALAAGLGALSILLAARLAPLSCAVAYSTVDATPRR